MRVLAMAVLLATTGRVHAGGMVLPVHGVRSLARGGAFIAGADGGDALWQNPAGLAHAAGDGTRTLLFDVALVYHPIDFTSIDGVKVSNEQPTQPVPTLAGSLGIGDRLVVAGGIAAPYQALHRFPKDSAARFASVSWTGSAFVVASAGIAYRVSDQLRVGASVQNLVSKLAWSLVVSGCPPMQTCDDADRSFDMPIEIEQTDYFSPSASLGVQWDPSPFVTLGLAVQGPMRVAGQGTLTATLPTNAQFDGGRIAGDDAEVSYWLPPAIRVGVEARPLPSLRVEAALAVELWSMHDDITIAPGDIAIENVAGGPYPFAEMTVARAFHTSYAPSLGVEYHLPSLTLAAGYAYETAAAPARTVSVLTVDGAKHLLSIGGGYDADGWAIGGALAYGIVSDVTSDSTVTRLAAIGTTTARDGSGTYASSYVIAGLRFARRW